MSKFLFPRNAHGDDAWLIELSDNPGCFLHAVSRKRNGDTVYTLRQGVVGATVFKKEVAIKLQRQLYKSFPNTKLTALKEVREANDGSEN